MEGLVRVRLIQRDKNPRGREEEEEVKEERKQENMRTWNPE